MVFSLLTTLIPWQIRERIPPRLVGLVYAALLLWLAVNILLPGLRSPLGERPMWVISLGHAI